MKTVTIDASAAAAWILPRQRTSSADEYLTGGVSLDLIAPDIFYWEIGNLIARRTAGEFERRAAMTVLHELQIVTAAPKTPDDVMSSVGPAVERRLSLFDNAYLQLSLERSASLATRDGRMIEVAQALGIEVFDLRS